MGNLQENNMFYNTNLNDLEILNENKIIKETLITEYSVEKNRAMYVFFRNQDIQLVEKILEQMGNKSLAVYFYKEENDLKDIFTYFDNDFLKDKFIIKKIDFSNVDKNNELQMQLHNLFYSYTQIYPIIAYRDNIEYIKEAKMLMKFIREKKENYSFLLGNDIDDTLYGLENRLINFEHHSNHPGIKDFMNEAKQIYKNKPAVIVSSGPSLDKNVHWLKKYQDKILIFSCDGSYTTLKKNGIKPHFIGSVERIIRTYEAFYEGKEFDKDLLLLAPAVVRKEILDKFKGNTISLFKDRDAFGVLMDEFSNSSKGKIWCGSSVAHLLFSVADNLKCNPIILIGQDLAYSLDGISHAGDSEVKETAKIEDAKIWLKGNYVDKLPSTPIWEKFLITFKEMVAKTDAKVINATQGGAFIEGTVIAELEKVLSEYCLETILKPAQIYYNIKEYQKYQDIIENYKEEYKKLFGKYFDLYRKVKDTLEKNKEAIEIFNNGIETEEELNQIYDSIDGAEDLVREIASDRLMMMMFQYPIHKAINEINQLKDKTYTRESLAVNLRSHYEMLYTIFFNTKRLLKILAEMNKEKIEIEGMEEIDWISNTEFDFIRN